MDLVLQEGEVEEMFFILLNFFICSNFWFDLNYFFILLRVYERKFVLRGFYLNLFDVCVV